MKVVLTCLKPNWYGNKNFYVQTSVQIDSRIFPMGTKYTDQIGTLHTHYIVIISFCVRTRSLLILFESISCSQIKNAQVNCTMYNWIFVIVVYGIFFTEELIKPSRASA